MFSTLPALAVTFKLGNPPPVRHIHQKPVAFTSPSPTMLRFSTKPATRERTMSSHGIHEHHEKAAEHHEHAAKHHREAATHAKAGDHEKASHHSHAAHGHALHAHEPHGHASKKARRTSRLGRKSLRPPAGSCRRPRRHGTDFAREAVPGSSFRSPARTATARRAPAVPTVGPECSRSCPCRHRRRGLRRSSASRWCYRFRYPPGAPRRRRGVRAFPS